MTRGWCPGALRPMTSGDGLIVRLKISGGIIDIRLVAEIARWSRGWGNGLIDLTSRANLQLRGCSEQRLPNLHDAMSEWSLLDRDAAAEAVRNVISSPLAGLDPDAALDVRPITKALEQRLASDARLHDLPAKFGFAIDDDGRLGLEEVAADIRFVACRLADHGAFEIRLAGAPNERLGPCPADALADVAAALGRAFLQLREGSGTPVRRMRDLVSAYGAETIAHAAQLAHSYAPRPAVSPSGFLGAQPLGSTAFLGVGLPFGRMVAEDLAVLASAAAEHGARELRLAAWRAILVPLPSQSAAQSLAAGLPAGRFVIDLDDPRLRIAACPGAPACAQASTSVRNDATTLADALAGAPRDGIFLHVSGCEKACAHPRRASVTLVARHGRYDLVRNGVASNAPSWSDLTLDQAAEQVRQIVAASTYRATA